MNGTRESASVAAILAMPNRLEFPDTSTRADARTRAPLAPIQGAPGSIGWTTFAAAFLGERVAKDVVRRLKKGPAGTAGGV